MDELITSELRGMKTELSRACWLHTWKSIDELIVIKDMEHQIVTISLTTELVNEFV